MSDEASTNISNKFDDLIKEQSLEKEIESKINSVLERAKQRRVKKYIDCDMKVTQFFT